MAKENAIFDKEEQLNEYLTESLDENYIQVILVSFKAIEETSEGIQRTQVQIKKIVENQRKTLEELKKFKQKLDGYAHLGDIDKIWGDCQKWHKDMASFQKEISATTELSKESIKRIEAFVNQPQMQLMIHEHFKTCWRN